MPKTRLVRIEVENGEHGARGWLLDNERHGLWVEKWPGAYRIAIYDQGTLKNETVTKMHAPEEARRDSPADKFMRAHRANADADSLAGR
jgi:hypothetical protein